MESQVVENGLDFILRAANDFWSEELSPEQQVKYSTIELYEGIELLLKARLMQEHWALVLRKIDDYKPGQLETGNFVSVNYATAIDRLSAICRVELEQQAKESFNALRQLRNRYVHFSCNEPRSRVLAVQLRAWHHILRMLETGFLGDLSELQQELLDCARSGMLRSEEFLDARFDEAQSALDEARDNGCTILTCPTCERISLVIGDGHPSCLVCGTFEIYPTEISEEYLEHTESAHFYAHDVAWCDVCGNQSLVPAGDEIVEEAKTRLMEAGVRKREPGEDWEPYICLSCNEVILSFSIRKCSSCGELYAGLDYCPVCGRL